MIIVRPQDAIHKAYLLRLLTAIVDHPLLSQSLYFKGGTCASMMGLLDRFSVDLDFDTKAGANETDMRTEFHHLFVKLNLKLSQESQNALEFFLKYPNKPKSRNSLKIDALNFIVKANKYAPVFLPEINRTVNCQTKETIFANKLVAVKDRYDRNKSIAGRDLYDLHHFFITGLKYDPDVITERTGMPVRGYLQYLQKFIEDQVSSTLIDQDLNSLLPLELFSRIRKTLKTEALMLIQNEIANLA